MPPRVSIPAERAEAGVLPRIRQTAYIVTRAHKIAALGRVLDVEAPTLAFVFCRTRTEVDELTETLNGRGYRSEALHGGTPFPAPMCAPAGRSSADGPLIEVGTEGLAVTTEGGYWVAKDLPINLPTFHYLARGALLRWWDSLALPTRHCQPASA